MDDKVGEDGSLPEIKGIDVEAALPPKSEPVSYTAKISPPEFARDCYGARGKDNSRLVLDYNYDIWSYGMFLYELAMGRSYFQGINAVGVIRTLSSDKFEVDVSDVEDEQLRDLISQCLNNDPKKRPTIAKVMSHPYLKPKKGAGL